MWKICQEASLKTKVMTHDSKGLPRQNAQRSLAWFPSPSGILIIEGKEEKAPLPAELFHFSTKKQRGLEAQRNQSGTGQPSSIESSGGQNPQNGS
jgi:hypothetical protein